MKKFYYALLLTTLFTLGSLYAQTGIGAAFAYGYDYGANNMGGVLTINTPVFPGTVQTVTLSFNSSDSLYFRFTDDWWVVQEGISRPLDIYVGLGFYTGVKIENEDADFYLGARAPIGLSLKPVHYLEIFMEVAPCMGLGFEPEIYFPAFDVQGALGFRLWF